MICFLQTSEFYFDIKSVNLIRHSLSLLIFSLASSLADSESPSEEFEEGAPSKSFDQKILGLASKLSECDVQENASENVMFPWSNSKEMATSSVMQALHSFDLDTILLSRKSSMILKTILSNNLFKLIYFNLTF